MKGASERVFLPPNVVGDGDNLGGLVFGRSIRELRFIERHRLS